MSCFLPALPAQPASPPPAAASDVRPVFGPYEAITYNRDYVQGVKVDDKGDIFIMFQPAKRDTQLVLRISQQEGAPYRKWFHGEIELVAQENAGREPNTWTDRVQTSANFIEYRDGQTIFLHLKKIKS